MPKETWMRIGQTKASVTCVTAAVLPRWVAQDRAGNRVHRFHQISVKNQFLAAPSVYSRYLPSLRRSGVLKQQRAAL